MLLTVKGPISFDDLRTYEGHTYSTYREACIARGLLENDNMQRLAFEEAAVTSFLQQLRNLFAVLLTQTSPANPTALWIEFKDDLMQVYKDIQNIDSEQAANMAHMSIEDMVMEMCGKQLHEFGLPNTVREAAERLGREYLLSLIHI